MAAALLDALEPTAVVAVERVGRNRAGSITADEACRFHT